MNPTHPVRFVREEILDELGLSIVRAAQVLGVRRATLSDLVNEKAALSPEMALRLEKAFGVSLDTLSRMQAWHDAHAMRRPNRRPPLPAGVRLGRFDFFIVERPVARFNRLARAQGSAATIT